MNEGRFLLGALGFRVGGLWGSGLSGLRLRFWGLGLSGFEAEVLGVVVSGVQVIRG